MELTAQQLRIGNWVNDKVTNTTCQVVEIRPNHVRIRRIYSSVSVVRDYDQIAPIPLTEEILIRLGFDSDFHDQIGVTYFLDGFELISTNAEPDKFGICLNGTDVYCDFVHEVQNLFYAIKKRELTLNN